MSDDLDDDYRSVLASVDRSGRRKWVYAAIVPGVWRRRRTILSTVLIVFYLALPFLTIGGEPVLRFDLVNKHYIVLGHTFWPQDFFFLLLALLMVVFTTLLLVSLFGRVFCGWICPHNVFLEGVFRRIETWCEGPAHKRRLADTKKPWPFGLIARKAIKWICYLLVVGAMANTATALFIGPGDFIGGVLVDGTKHPTAATFFVVFFGLNLFNFAWFREQTCLILCPYGRLQSALTDDDTLVIGYDAGRGEPRGSVSTPGAGDCVDCLRCVEVCPTAIDIREGLQLECIGCANCIDACDDVMTRVGRPIGLIRYDSLSGLAGRPKRLARPRVALYAVILVALLGATALAAARRRPFEATLIRQVGAPYVVDAGHYRNQYVVHVVNKTPQRTTFELTVVLPDAAATAAVPIPSLTLDSLGDQRVPVTVSVPVAAFRGAFDVTVETRDTATGAVVASDLAFVGP